MTSGSVSGAGADVQVARLRRRDLRRCAEIEHELFPLDGPWNVPAFHAELDSGAYYLGAYDADGALLGYAGLAIVRRGGRYEAEVHTIGVVPGAQGRGVGRALLDRLLTRADELDSPVVLNVRTDNEVAIALYAKNGFATLGLTEGYYQPSGADAYTMRRDAMSERRSERDNDDEASSGAER